jgi:predicted ATPase/DNA-binding SARP family transcriptional activator
MLFDVLGPLRIRTDDGALVAVREPKVRALLADLLTHHGQPVPVDRLIDDLWEESPPGNPVNTLQTKVSQLRRALERAEAGGRALVSLTPAGYVLRTDDEAVDASRFTALTGRAQRSAHPRERAKLLGDALALWRGPAFAEFRDAPFTRATVARLDEQYLTALEELAEARLELGEHGQLAADLGESVRAHPLRERLRAAYVLALYRAGRQTEALATYAELKERLSEELGLDPGPELAVLHAAVLRQDPALDAPADVAPRQAPASRLPTPLTELIGREDDVARVGSLLSAGRLVTLVGPGGVGKTRIALEAAARAADAHPDGVRLVELAPLKGDLVPAVAAALDIREDAAGAADDHLAQALKGRTLLLVLDNCEHVIDEAGRLVAHLLAHAPGLRVLATSQEPLAVHGESLHLVAPLAEDDAIALFATRARAAAPGFALGPANADAVAQICSRLDGIPLALELAAARVRALGVHGLAARIDDRFRVLAAGRRDAPARQRTLRAVIDWSWDLLTGDERILLRRMAVFAGGCTSEAAEAVCASPDLPAESVLDTLARLVDRSLVAVTDDAGENPRYGLLESIAAYGLERLDEAGEMGSVRLRHGQYFAGLAERAEPHLDGPGQCEGLALLDQERANLSAALADAVTDDAVKGDAVTGGAGDLAIRLVNALSWYWFLRGRHAEAHRSLTAALSLPGADTEGRVDAETRQAAFALLTGRRVADTVVSVASRAGARARWLLELARCGFDAAPGGDDAAAAATALLAEFAERGDRWGVAAAHTVLATQAVYSGDLAAQRRHATESAALFERLGDAWGRLQSTEHLGMLAEIAGDYDRAMRLHQEGIRLAEQLRLWTELSFRLSRAGRIALLTGDLVTAADLTTRARTLAAEQSHRPAEQFADTGLALVARRQGDLDTAEALLRPWLDWNRDHGVDAGAALVLAQLGFAAEQRGLADQALALHLDGLRLAERTGDLRAVALALEGLAGARAIGGFPEHAAELLGTATALRESTGSPLPAAERFDTDRVTAHATETLGTHAFTTALNHGRLLTPHDHRDRLT